MALLRTGLCRVRPTAILAAVSCSRPVARPSALQWYSSKAEETAEEFDAKWIAYFNRQDIDSWELRHGLNEIYGHDLVPEPEIVVAMINAARRLNDVAMAIRILESVKETAAGNKEVYNYVMDAIRPTLNELGLNTPAELGLE